jgi:nucleolar protein 12
MPKQTLERDLPMFSLRYVYQPFTHTTTNPLTWLQDVMAVDEALLLHEKRMPNDRKLRVTRARTIKRNAKRSTENDRDRRPDPTSHRPRDNIKGSIYQPKVDPRKRDQLNRASKILGRAAAAQLKSQGDVFEGLRATANTDSGIKKGGSGKKAGKPRARAVARSQAWKAKNAK